MPIADGCISANLVLSLESRNFFWQSWTETG